MHALFDDLWGRKTRPPVLRYLRIAVTVLSLTACVLLTVLCVRSYCWSDGFQGAAQGWFIEGESEKGQLWAAAYNSGSAVGWQLDTFPTSHAEAGKLVFYLGYSSGAVVFVPHWYLTLAAAAVSRGALDTLAF
jgi:hypothetical protein